MAMRHLFILLALSVLLGTSILSPVPTFGGSNGKESWREAIKEVVGNRKPTEGRVLISASNIAKLGEPLLFTVSVSSPMTSKDYVKVVHVFATKGPWRRIVSFHFTPLSGEASATTKIRVSETCQLIAVAQLSDGAWFMARHDVKVSAGAYTR